MKQILRQIRVALTPRAWVLRSRLENGAVVYGENRHGYGGRGVYVFRDNIEPELAVLDRFLEPSGVLMDIGANTGVYTLKAAKHLAMSGGTVIAVEPFSDVFGMLSYSVRRNRLRNVRLRNLCVGASTRVTELWMNFERPHSFSLLKTDQTALACSVLRVALDDLVTWEGVERLDYLKIDAEGSEGEILFGGQKTLAKYRPIIQVEVNKAALTCSLEDYHVFRANRSSNEVWIPSEHPTRKIALELGWKQVI